MQPPERFSLPHELSSRALTAGDVYKALWRHKFFILALTFIGTFMRGPYWQIYWPWQAWPEMPTRL